jgi:hypothetical protein
MRVRAVERKLHSMKKSSPIAVVTAIGLTLVLAGVALAATVVVRPSSPGNWVATASGTASTTFVSGPGTPPLGGGSAQLAVGSGGNSAAQLRNTGYAGTALADLSELSYWTYVDVDGSGGQAPYIILQLDLDGNGTVDDLLFFEPVYQTATFFPSNPQPALLLDTWQEWDALEGGWWSLNGLAGATPGTGVKSIDDYLAVEPDATIVNSANGDGGVRLVAGFGAGAWDNFVGNVDGFTIGIDGDSTTYDFEPNLPQPANKNACKGNAWMGLARADGSTFKNQGDCIQYANTGK